MIQSQRQNWYCNSRNCNLYFMALHGPCLRIAKRAMQLSHTAHVRTLGDLWLTLERRTENVIKLQDGLIPILDPFIPAIPEDSPKSRSVTGPVKLGLSRYFVDPKRVLGAVDDRGWEEDAHGPPLTDRWVYGHWNADPECVPILTHSPLSNLDEYEPTPNPLSSFKDHLEALPQEIKDRILQFLPYDMPLECTYLLDQSHWCALFLQIPFLWDLNVTMVHAKLSGDTLGGQGVAKLCDTTITWILCSSWASGSASTYPVKDRIGWVPSMTLLWALIHNPVKRLQHLVQIVDASVILTFP
ncbi:unnamed protein product [Fusarium equiseti]|uniref:F-box domain-containing protein n=1 Tax=Fusarium equiseti TaxID=61235 RepID=A0A8J2NNC6_FUSEQ|nr:unnamed protein product [Fusarium equiseti]